MGGESGGLKPFQTQHSGAETRLRPDYLPSISPLVRSGSCSDVFQRLADSCLHVFINMYTLISPFLSKFFLSTTTFMPSDHVRSLSLSCGTTPFARETIVDDV